MKKILSLLSLILSIGAMPNFAQTESQDIIADYKQKMDSVLQFVDREQFQTGLLYDYGFHLLNPEMFKGEPTDSVCIDLNALETLYIGLYDSRINDKHPFPPPEALRQEKNTNEVRIMYIEYDKIDEDALDKGWVTFENEQIRLVEGKPSPFFRDFCFAATPKTTDFSSNIVSVRFTRSQFYTNANCEITKIEVKSDEDVAFEQVEMETVWTKSFSTTGRHKLTFRVSLSNGKVLESASELNIRKKVNGKYGVAFGKKIDRFAQITPDYSQAGGEIQAIYLNREKTGGKFIRPLIVVGDFDLTALFGGEAMDLESLSSTPGVGEQMKALSQIFDIIYIKYNDSTDDLMRNGEFVRKAIKLINENRFAVSDDSYVVGLGVGGVVSRIALNLMEQDGEQHKVQKFIAVNAPFRGMNIPLSLQALIRQINGLGDIANIYKPVMSQKIKNIYAFIKSCGVRQLLYAEIDDKFQVSSKHYDWFFNNNAFAKNNPKLCKNITISSGRNNLDSMLGSSKNLFSYYSIYDLIDSNFISFFFDQTFEIEIDGYIGENAENQTIYNGFCFLRKKPLFKRSKITTISKYSINVNNGTILKDKENGSYLPIGQLNSINGFSLFSNKVCLVPTLSAFDANDMTSIPFDKHYASINNTSHFDYSNIFKILKEELVPKISGNLDNIIGATELVAENVPNIPIVKYDWNFKNNQFKVISTTGTSATITPLTYGNNATDIVSVTPRLTLPVDVGDLSGLSISANLSAKEISFIGKDYISTEPNVYGLSDIPADVESINWMASEGVSIEKFENNSILAKIDKDKNGSSPWIEADFLSCGESFIFHKDFKIALLDSIVITEVKSWKDKHQNVDKFHLRVTTYPQTIPNEELDFCWDNDIRIHKNVLNKESNIDSNVVQAFSKAKITTKGNVGFCEKPPLAQLPDSISTGIITRPLSFPPPEDDYEPFIAVPNEAVITMPVINADESAKGRIYCTVSDFFGNTYKASVYVESKWNAVYHAAPNPADSYLNISRQGSDAVAPMRAPATNEGSPVARALLYNDSMLVREAAIGADGTCRMNVGDLAEGNYYLNIVENDRIVMKQIVVIQH